MVIMPNDPDYMPDARISEEDLPKPGSNVKPDATANPTEKARQEEINRMRAAAGQPTKPLAQPGKPEDKVHATGAKLEDENVVEEEPEGAGKKVGKLFKELLITAVITIGIVFVINNFIFQAYYVSGSSMEPNYHNNDYLIIAKWPLTLTNIANTFGAKANLPLRRGQVIVFRYPNAPETFFIKRVIGLPGERVVLHDGVYTIYNKEHPEGFKLVEDYPDPSYKTLGDVDTIVEPQNFFVSGDNRSPGGSFDSREWGQLNQKFITGIAELRLLPIGTFGLVRVPDFNQ